MKPQTPIQPPNTNLPDNNHVTRETKQHCTNVRTATDPHLDRCRASGPNLYPSKREEFVQPRGQISTFPNKTKFCSLGAKSLPFQTRGSSATRFRAKRDQHGILKKLEPESQGQNLALTVLYLPYLLDSGFPSEGKLCTSGFSPAVQPRPNLISHNLFID